MIAGGWTFDAKDGWHLDPSQAERVREATRVALAWIDDKHRRMEYPQCGLCGQRAIALDEHGLCSKVDARHKIERGVLV